MTNKESEVDVLERILNCGEGMRDVHDAVAEVFEADREFDTASDGYNPLYANAEQYDRYRSAERRRRAALRKAGVKA